MEQLVTEGAPRSVAQEPLGAPDPTSATICFALLAAGAVGAAIGDGGWAVAGLAWLAAAVCWHRRPRREDLVRRRLEAAADPPSNANGASHFEVAWDREGRQGSCVLGSLQDAGVAAIRLNGEGEAESDIYCFESVVWPDIGNVPHARYEWDGASARWHKIATVEEKAASAAVEKREHERRQAMCVAALND